MDIFETDRLIIREFDQEDAPMIFELLNEPGWKKYIGDRGINSLDDARDYIKSLIGSYEKNGFGLWAVELKDTRELVGMCGLLKRDTLDDIDIGFALLSRFEGRGYAREAAIATLDFAQRELGIDRVVAITTQDNQRSGNLLEKIGMQYESPHVGTGGETLRLFAIMLAR
jgi:RimJ/RimL family protein N-acetyltransferase